MQYPFRKALTRDVKSYADHTPTATGELLDCSLGVNPYGFPTQVIEAMRQFNPSLLSEYPHSRVLHRALCEYWPGLREDELILANGSVCGLYCVNNIFSMTPRQKVVGFVPSFTDMVESVRCFGMHYTGVPLRLDEGGVGLVEDLIVAIGEDTALVYLDRPNNPTGQVMAISDVEKLLDAAAAAETYVLVDEAYGDFIPREESAITLHNRYDNLMVLRTFSKGFGLANLRCGYLVAPKKITQLISQTTNPYLLSDMERLICAQALKQPGHPTAHADDFSKCKHEIRRHIGQRLQMLCTDDRIPICTLSWKEGNLQAELLRHGVLTVSGKEFDALDKHYVRLRIPRKEQAERLMAAILSIEKAK